MSNETLDYDTLIRALLPKGAAWEPQSFQLGSTPGGELIVNGDFTDESGPPTGIAGWTLYSVTEAGQGASCGISPGSGQCTFSAWAV